MITTLVFNLTHHRHDIRSVAEIAPSESIGQGKLEERPALYTDVSESKAKPVLPFAEKTNCGY